MWVLTATITMQRSYPGTGLAMLHIYTEHGVSVRPPPPPVFLALQLSLGLGILLQLNQYRSAAFEGSFPHA